MSGDTKTVSDRACTGLDHFVAISAKSALAASGNDCPVTPTEHVDANEKKVAMLTVSSYMFRALLFIHFDANVVTREHFAALDNVPLEDMDGERFLDAVMERGNLCCGAFNRELAVFFPHTGMSTPCILDRSSLEHVQALKPAVTRHYRAEPAPGMVLHMTLAVCAFADLDFPFEPRAVVEEDTAGELEMF